jgi:hypothetical protein
VRGRGRVIAQKKSNVSSRFIANAGIDNDGDGLFLQQVYPVAPPSKSQKHTAIKQFLKFAIISTAASPSSGRLRHGALQEDAQSAADGLVRAARPPLYFCNIWPGTSSTAAKCRVTTTACTQ